MIIISKYSGAADRSLLGGKGANLLQLSRASYPVPSFFIVPAVDEIDTVQLRTELLTLTDTDKLYAVRSSATIEDSEAHSFAGQFKTILNVAPEHIMASIEEVRASSKSAHLDAYMKSAGIDQDVLVAVVIQEMVPATEAGVALGIDPISGNEDHISISAVNGLGEQLVSGESNADEYTIDRKTERITHKTIAEKAILSDEKIRMISDTLISLEQFFGSPQDIEFAFEGTVFHLLQSRPVTTKKRVGTKYIWDNSNIVESYPGLTLPLTFSFIEKMYAAVYRQFSAVLGVRSKKIRANENVYASMLGLLNGRVYYNLNSWFKALAQLPGYNANAAFMEKMMGVKERPPFDEPIQQPTKKDLAYYIEVGGAAVAILKNLFTARKQKDQFIQNFEAIYRKFEPVGFKELSAKELFNNYSAFEKMMVEQWKAPLVNDFFAMIFFGVLQKQCISLVPEEPNLHNELIADAGDIITTAPIKLLPKLADAISRNSELARAIEELSPEDFWKVLQQPEFEKEKELIQDYIRDWGERCVAELKLETITYTQDPALLMRIIRSYVQHPYHHDETSTTSIRSEAEEKIFAALKGKPVKKWLFKYILKQARYFVSNRENLRYYRTKGFGMVRRMMFSTGEKLAVTGALETPRDIFYLELNEVAEAANNNHVDLKKLITARKKDYALFETLPLPERVISYGMPEKIILTDPKIQTTQTQNDTLQGIPCSAGIVRATVKKLHYSDELNSLEGQILATYATDPGWVVLFPSAYGILTERGSLLSHAAIVSREMKIPCIVGIEGLMEQLNDGDELIMDGSTGLVKILKHG